MKLVHALGVMTGTSCDGADLALLAIYPSKNGATVQERLIATGSAPFSKALRARLREAQTGKLDIVATALLTRDYSAFIAKTCEAHIRRWKTARASLLIAVHGQTVWHAPQDRISVQLLDPSVIALATGCTVASAFRQSDLTLGGQGAPLVPFYHWLRATQGKFARALPFAVHNVGGIANLTYVTKDKSKVIAFDTGPGNALIDMAVEEMSDGKQRFDQGGRIASSALEQLDWRLIEKLGKLPYFKKSPPKSTGRELFNRSFLESLPGRGAAKVAVATAFTAHTMAQAYSKFILNSGRELNGVFVAGGGAQNPVLMSLFSRELARLTREEIPVGILPETFAPPQSLEAMAFARLGYEAIQGRPVSLASVTGASEDAIGASIFPGRNYALLLRRISK